MGNKDTYNLHTGEVNNTGINRPLKMFVILNGQNSKMESTGDKSKLTVEKNEICDED